MGIKEELKAMVGDFKSEQKKRREFKKKLDFKKYQAVEIAKAQQEVKDIRSGKKKKEMSDADLLGFDIEKITL